MQTPLRKRIRIGLESRLMTRDAVPASLVMAFMLSENGFQFPFSFQLRPSLVKLSAARSIAFRVLFKASQASDVGSIPIARSINPVYGPKRSFTERSEDIVYS